MPVAGAPLAPSDLELADSERLTDGHLPLWTLVASAPGLARNLWRRRVLRLSTMKSRSVLDMLSERFPSQTCACVSARPISSACFFVRSGVASHARWAASSPVLQARNSRSAAIQ